LLKRRPVSADLLAHQAARGATEQLARRDSDGQLLGAATAHIRAVWNWRSGKSITESKIREASAWRSRRTCMGTSHMRGLQDLAQWWPVTGPRDGPSMRFRSRRSDIHERAPKGRRDGAGSVPHVILMPVPGFWRWRGPGLPVAERPKLCAACEWLVRRCRAAQDGQSVKGAGEVASATTPGRDAEDELTHRPWLGRRPRRGQGRVPYLLARLRVPARDPRSPRERPMFGHRGCRRARCQRLRSGVHEGTVHVRGCRRSAGRWPASRSPLRRSSRRRRPRPRSYAAGDAAEVRRPELQTPGSAGACHAARSSQTARRSQASKSMQSPAHESETKACPDCVNLGCAKTIGTDVGWTRNTSRCSCPVPRPLAVLPSSLLWARLSS
jgi:hypothetical protein